MRDRLFFEQHGPERTKAIAEFIAKNKARIESLPNFKAVRAAYRGLASVAAGKKRKKGADGTLDILLIAQAKEDWKRLGFSEFEIYAIGVYMLQD